MDTNQSLWDSYEPVVWSWIIKVFFSILIFFVGKWLARVLTNALRRVMERANVDETLVKFLGNIVNTVLVIAVIIAAVDQLGVKTTSFLAILGAAGLAVGLALQGSLANFSSGVMLIMFRPFKVGDYVDAGGVSGVVKAIRFFKTVMRTPDNREITVPNAQIFESPITNYSARSTRRVDMVVGISYDDDIGKAFQVIQAVLDKDDRVLKDPATTLMVLDLADSSVNLAVRPWVNGADYWPARSDLLHQLKVELEAAGLSIPYPQQDVHMRQAA